jgi:membrane protein DedA with SNARE-associated domain
VLGLTLLGVQVGPSWERWRHRLEYLDYIVAAAIVIGIVYLVIRARRRRGVAVDIP